MMIFARLPLALVALALALLAIGCVPHRMHRAESVLRFETEGYAQAFIEIDDHGELWSPRQLQRAIELLETSQSHPDGALVNVFVHGWNNDASSFSESSGNIRGHRTLLRLLAENERSTRPDDPRPVVGLYIGWRGRSLVGPLNFLTFYGRRRAAVRVAGVTATSSLYRLLNAAKSNPRSRVVLMGHSFGGLVVERTLAQALIGDLMAPGREERETVHLPADLVVLFNPASSSLGAKQFVEALERNRLRFYRQDPRGVDREMPLVVSVTSEGDWATGRLYPLGLQALALGKSFRDGYGEDSCGVVGRQRTFATRTAGHFPSLHSHEVVAERLPERERLARSPSSTTEGSSEAMTGPMKPLDEVCRWEFDASTRQPAVVFEGAEHRYRIRRKPRASNDTPYWIMRVPRSLIPDHSRIFNYDTFQLIAALMHSTGALDADASTRIVREDGVRPIGVAPFGDDGVIFLDRTRRLYTVEPGAETPRFVGCLPAAIDPREGLGFDLDETGYLSAMRDRVRGQDVVRVVEVDFEGERVTLRRESLIEGPRRFGLATFDVVGRRAFLVPFDSNEIWVAEVTSRKRARGLARRLVSLDGYAPIAVLRYRAGHDSLFVADGAGVLYEVELGPEAAPAAEVEPIAVRRLAEGLGWPTALEYDATRDRLFLADALDRRVMRFDCGPRCAPPVVHARCDVLERPTSLRVLEGGDLWIGDPSAERLVRVSSDGEIVDSYRSLP